MFSILIPTYNYDCSRLIGDLDAQCAVLMASTPGFDYEIILGDDASTDETSIRANRDAVAHSAHCRYVAAEKNAGQATLRNRLADEAQFPYLLFFDSDAEVCTENFIATYWANRDKAYAVCGAVRNPDGEAVPGTELRWRYEHKAEGIRTVEYRMKHPYSYLTGFNLLIRRDVFQRIRFDARCTQYGYEDALFGLELQRQGFSIVHIDNPLIHLGIDSNASFLAKTETALRTLYALGGPMQDFAGASRFQRKLQRAGLSWLFAAAFCMIRPLLRHHLLGHNPSLRVFDVYKLGYYCNLCRKGRK